MQQAEQQRNNRYHEALIDFLYQMADDELTIGHRGSEWLGVAPDLEEDIAFSSISQDEVGHATFYFELLSELGEGDPDQLAFARTANQRKNARLLERPNHDWAYTIARGYFYDVFDHLRLQELLQSNYIPLQKGVQKILREERYHLLHMETWFERLAKAQGEAKERLEKAITAIWTDLPDLFSLGQSGEILREEGIFPISESTLYDKWAQQVKALFDHSGLTWPAKQNETLENGRLGVHSSDLQDLLNVMTEVYRSDLTATW
ncbi:1,2-phenylacetyl-CoA epoxidase subunit PaaC [Sulfoacidibacillus thermotolerans]|uniref:Phenylacetate-CoA oxygenase subunit PaaI n=1 Tax=Sulfoacidibacillus thermotolerans TaxID=1765684 RepID=A0A2U3D757_SULT2|nr:1,2-phenylacetyl-CoA epoxidase subunit PaaC [Sulfoacidibacillus thermotolerans]PWI57119.1 phenylacetate-CoA oxygenase subunit PaaI [Sulfoacidibacillus thermotolerans]